MKSILTICALALSLSQVARAERIEVQLFDDMSAPEKYDSPIGECDGITDEERLRECQSWRTCIARDVDRNRFKFTGSYGKPNKYIVARAVAACQAGSPKPSTCHVTVCRFGRQ